MRTPLIAGLIMCSPASAAAPEAQPRILLVTPVSNAPDDSDNATAILPLADGALISGWTSKPGAKENGLLVRVDGRGDVVWRRVVGGEGEDLLWSVVADGDGFIAVGHTTSKGAGSLDGWMIRVDAKGELVWEKTFGGTGDDRFYSFAPVTGGFACVGQKSSSGAGKSDAWVLKTDASGNQIASWTWGTPEVERAFAIQPAGDGFVLSGMTGPGEKEASAFVACLDSGGKEIWRVLQPKPGFGVAHGIAPLPDGKFLVTGYDMPDAAKGADGFAFVVDQNGHVQAKGTFGGKGNDRALHAATFADGSSVVVGYSQAEGARDGMSGWDLTLYALGPNCENTWTGRFGGPGPEMGRAIAGTARDLWVVGQTSLLRPSGSGLYLIRLDVSVLGANPQK